jgi:hypothetical protein
MSKGWMSDEAKREKHAGTKGSLTRIAHRAGYSTATEYARHVRAHPEGVSTKTKRKANMAMMYAKARNG